jgi:hypothetical protein
MRGQWIRVTVCRCSGCGLRKQGNAGGRASLTGKSLVLDTIAPTLFCFLFGGTRVQTLGLVLVRQALYHLSHAPKTTALTLCIWCWDALELRTLFHLLKNRTSILSQGVQKLHFLALWTWILVSDIKNLNCKSFMSFHISSVFGPFWHLTRGNFRIFWLNEALNIRCVTK